MPPPHVGTVPLLAASDAFDIPVVLHLTPRPVTPMARRPSRQAIDAATGIWAHGSVPTSGIYRIPTSWLQVLASAISVGRDLRPWLAAAPHLALAELVARIYPLQAYLALDQSAATPRVVANPIYTIATERSAKASIGYRLGMTMADWVCRGPLGLGPTFHAETTPPNGKGKAWSNVKTQPDLVCAAQSARPWLVEAKGGGRVSRAALVKGAAQLNSRQLMAGPHHRVLCGASLDHRLHMTVDIDLGNRHSELAPNDDMPYRGDGALAVDIDENDTSWALVVSQLIVYYALVSLPEQFLSVVTVDRATTADAPTWLPRRLRRTGADQDVESAHVRSGGYATVPMIVGAIPGTALTVGMSARMFAACEALAARDSQITASVGAADPFPVSVNDSTDDGPVRRGRRDFHDVAREAEWTTRDIVLSTLDSMQSASIADAVRGRRTVPGRTVDPALVFEAASADTYLAVGRAAIPVTDESTR